MSWTIGLAIFAGVMYITCLVLMGWMACEMLDEGDELIKEWEAAREAERSERNK